MASNTDINFDSYMVLTSELEKPVATSDDKAIASGRMVRLLEVDNRVLLPLRTDMRFIITSADVIHS